MSMSRDEEEHDQNLVGSTVGGKYRIDRLVGRGGMGAVFEATNVGIGKRVALKFLDRDAARDADAVTRFQREAEAASAVESAHIVHIFDTGAGEDGRPFLVMELLTGEDLRSMLRREGRIETGVAIHIVGQVLRGLARAHAAGIVHRDLKPDNVFVCRRDDDPMFVKLVDFGISKITRRETSADTLTRRGTVLGTAFYMSPEQAQAFPDIDGRADLYSVGAILFEALAGRPPHVGSVYEAVLIEICTKDAPDIRSIAPDVPEAVADVIKTALSRNRAERFANANEMYDALVLAAPGLLRSNGPGVPTAPLRKPGADATAISSATSDAVGRVATAEGTAVQPSGPGDSRAHTRRTIVTAIVAALGAFAVTVFLMANRPSRNADGASAATPGPSATLTAEPALSAEPTAVSPAPSTSASADAGPVRAVPTAAKPPGTTAKPAPAKPTASAAPAVSAKPHPTGVATGLQLDTSGP